ncbi:hypothetical protein TNCV_956831 [Trichonephila clavipes]|nr:hypothetical protein TNCV_956831 [Trichonephila clavipes]
MDGASSVMKKYPGGYSQCQSDWSIDRPSILVYEDGDVNDLSRDDFLSERTNRVGTKTEDSGRIRPGITFGEENYSDHDLIKAESRKRRGPSVAHAVILKCPGFRLFLRYPTTFGTVIVQSA